MFIVYIITIPHIIQVPYSIFQNVKRVATSNLKQKLSQIISSNIDNAERRIGAKNSTLSCQIYLRFHYMPSLLN